MRLEIFPVEGLPEIGRGDDIAGMICDAVMLLQLDGITDHARDVITAADLG